MCTRIHHTFPLSVTVVRPFRWRLPRYIRIIFVFPEARRLVNPAGARAFNVSHSFYQLHCTQPSILVCIRSARCSVCMSIVCRAFVSELGVRVCVSYAVCMAARQKAQAHRTGGWMYALARMWILFLSFVFNFLFLSLRIVSFLLLASAPLFSCSIFVVFKNKNTFIIRFFIISCARECYFFFFFRFSFVAWDSF